MRLLRQNAEQQVGILKSFPTFWDEAANQPTPEVSEIFALYEAANARLKNKDSDVTMAIAEYLRVLFQPVSNVVQFLKSTQQKWSQVFSSNDLYTLCTGIFVSAMASLGFLFGSFLLGFGLSTPLHVTVGDLFRFPIIARLMVAFHQKIACSVWPDSYLCTADNLWVYVGISALSLSLAIKLFLYFRDVSIVARLIHGASYVYLWMFVGLGLHLASMAGSGVG